MILVHDPHAAPPPRERLREALGPAGRARVQDYLAACPRHRPTPLVALPGLAARLGLGALFVKDEGQRLGLGSFKALGGAYAVMRLVIAAAEAALGRTLRPEELQSEAVRLVAAGMTMACATDGNHGRSVAAGARLAGCRSVVFVHQGVSQARADAIAGFGAEIRRVAGSYDDSVVEAARQAAAQGWTVVSDTSWEGYEDIPLDVMQGYTVLAGEAFDALPDAPTHIVLQAGVGGLAAAVAMHASEVYGPRAPRIVVVEPARAACLLASARAGRPTVVPHDEPTVMAMLECYEPSRLAFEILAARAHAFVAAPEERAVEAMRALALPQDGDPAIVAGESGGAGLAGLLECLADEKASAALGLGPDARVLLVVSEGATDPALYARLTGLDPRSVATPKVSP
ncbi:diaminopropionate ammonia-lyase [Alsobacter sp. SYSU M60028]|uniref:Diaminopropionate ammonia-lyase n=1 Tax=Alsobacter ponti TaxID=2962936 RepID=A0ABT1L831_9HYPH|nr:diaminopropionate ammonia-lyase [Alsobacter ponti]MCP8937539.1 diaminopropionate ammonia-lyase [Alsobacter ponti]